MWASFSKPSIIPVLTARENVELPALLTNLSKKERIDHAETALKLVGLGDRLGRTTAAFWRTGTARGHRQAIVTDPALILADDQLATWIRNLQMRC
jgi:putative ABC transport system ATP-binding protein